MRATERLISALPTDLVTIDQTLLCVEDEARRSLLLECRAAVEEAIQQIRTGVAGPATLWAAREVRRSHSGGKEPISHEGGLDRISQRGSTR